ncbi:MAG: PadR family transcriptional regulator [Candidatus Nanohaloarchaea archaeon]
MSEVKLTHVYRLYTLLILKSGPAHGYKIISKIEEMTGEKPSTSHIYPFLSELEEEGYLESETGSRGKKIYSLTVEGKSFVAGQLDSFGEMLYAALKDRVQECHHCDCKIYGDGYEKAGNVYCCKHCADDE